MAEITRIPSMELQKFLTLTIKALRNGMVAAEDEVSDERISMRIPGIEVELRGSFLPKEVDGKEEVHYDPDEGAKVDRSTLKFLVNRLPD